MFWLTGLAIAIGQPGCRQRKHRQFKKGAGYQNLASFEGTYEVLSRKESLRACDETLQDMPASSRKFRRLSIKNTFGYDSLFFFDCTTPDSCDMPETPLFVPFVRENAVTEPMTGELERQAIFSKSRNQCYLARKEATLTQTDNSLEYQIVDTEGLFPITEADCQVELASAKKAELGCKKKVVIGLKRVP